MRRLLAPLLILAACDSDPTPGGPLEPLSFASASAAERVQIARSVFGAPRRAIFTVRAADDDASSAPGCPGRALEGDAVVYHAAEACEHPTSGLRWKGRAEVSNARFQPLGLPYDPSSPTTVIFDQLQVDAEKPLRLDGTVVQFGEDFLWQEIVSLTVEAYHETRVDAAFTCDDYACWTTSPGTGWLAGRGSYTIELDPYGETPHLTLTGADVLRVDLASFDERGCYRYTVGGVDASGIGCM